MKKLRYGRAKQKNYQVLSNFSIFSTYYALFIIYSILIYLFMLFKLCIKYIIDIK